MEWYPTLKLRIEGHEVIGDFDTGAKGLFVSEYFLNSIGVNTSIFDSIQIAYHLNSEFQFYTKNLKISLISNQIISDEIEMPCFIVKNFENSPLAFLNKERKALVGRDILDYFKPLTIELDSENNTTQVIFKNWKTFEKEVANLYRNLGIKVKRNVNLAGNQIDVLLEEETSSGKIIKTIVECKFYKKPVGIKEVKELSLLFEFTKSQKLTDHAVLVSSSGFTQDAYLVSEKSNLELLEIEDLRSKVFSKIKKKGEKSEALIEDETEGEVESNEQTNNAFVIMPFKEEYSDVYILGVREVLNKFGYVSVRGDEVQFNGRIMDKIQELIRNSNIVIAEVTERNPNVYYELGIAHSLGKNVILCTQNLSNAPFDIVDLNHIICLSTILQWKNCHVIDHI